MGSADVSVSIQRYPEDSGDRFLGFSYGCPELGLMGFVDVEELSRAVSKDLKKMQARDMDRATPAASQ